MAFVLPSSGAHAQSTSYPLVVKREFTQTCVGELQTFCPGPDVGIGAQAACLKQYHVSLSLPCRRVLARMDARRAQPE